MAKRHIDALNMQAGGASNPSGILHSMLEACTEIRDEGGNSYAIRTDPALRLMAHQLGDVMGVYEYFVNDDDQWNAAIAKCYNIAEGDILENYEYLRLEWESTRNTYMNKVGWK